MYKTPNFQPQWCIFRQNLPFILQSLSRRAHCVLR